MNAITATELRETSMYQYRERFDDDTEYEAEPIYIRARYYIWMLRQNDAGVGLRNLDEDTRVSSLATLLWFRDFLTHEGEGGGDWYAETKEQLLWELKGILESAGVVGY